MLLGETGPAAAEGRLVVVDPAHGTAALQIGKEVSGDSIRNECSTVRSMTLSVELGDVATLVVVPSGPPGSFGSSMAWRVRYGRGIQMSATGGPNSAGVG